MNSLQEELFPLPDFLPELLINEGNLVPGDFYLPEVMDSTSQAFNSNEIEQKHQTPVPNFPQKVKSQAVPGWKDHQAVQFPLERLRFVSREKIEERQRKISRYMKKRSTRNFARTVKYECRKVLADNQPRVRGRFTKAT